MHTPFPECIKTLTDSIQDPRLPLIVDICLDPGFAAFYDWTLKTHVPLIVLSSGMEPIIRALLEKLIGPKAQNIPILSNNVETLTNGLWRIVFRDESRKSIVSKF